MRIDTLIRKIKEYNDKPDTELIKKAYYFAKKHHGAQRRVSGELFIQHPLNVAYILAEHKMDCVTISSALLHDVVEDTDVTKKDIVTEFSKEIADIIEGVTKITKLREMSFEEYRAETVRKVILASTRDIRVIFIKLADKVHNMRTLSCFREEKCQRIAKEVMNIYAPIAYKLGIASIKWELEDLAFRYIEPEIYIDLENKVHQSQKLRQMEVDAIGNVLTKELEEHSIKGRVTGRPKHLYSIYKKMIKKDKPFEEIYDVLGLRIITEKVRDCYEIMGIVHGLWTPVPKEFDDYIAMPKSNMYQSLHLVVLGPNGKPVEIQIRTEEMHRIAEDGIAAHWKYKGVAGDRKFDEKLNWMKQVLEWQNDSEDAKEFMEMLNVDFFEDEIFTFTPRGRVIELPKGASVLDFAYMVHSDIGDKTIAAKINSKFVPLRTLLKNGDMIEIITSKNQKPSRDWLKIVRTSKAQSRIKKFIRSVEDIPVKSFGRVIEGKKELEEWIIDVQGVINPDINVAKCCSPLPGDKILGYSSPNGKVIIHKKNCKRLEKVKMGVRKKKVKVMWTDNIGSVIEIKVDALNRTGLFAEILNSLVAINVAIKSANAKSTGDETVECSFSLETAGLEHLQDLITRIKNIKDVKKVFIGSMVR
jgi:GTP diphosphokinase / guanosine-3',5'-bis(diphosphate) 3'-diphosphatase